MFGYFSPSAHRPTPARRLSLESLETRDCPSTFVTNPLLPVDLNAAAQAQQTNGPAGPYTVTMFHVMGPNQSVEVSGMVTGPNVANLVVEFEGPMTGYVVTDANGAFSFTTNASFLGTELAGVVSVVPGGPNAPGGPGSGTIQSNVAQDVIADAPPIITNFAVQLVSGTTYEFEGQVTTTYPAGLVVTFGGVPLSSQGQTATVSAAGTFDVTINMSNGALDNGLATAEIFADAWGLSSNTAVTQINVT